MAQQYIGLDVPFKASGSMSSPAYYFVKMNADNVVDVCSATTDIAIGISQTAGVADQSISIRVSGHTKITLSETVAIGQLICPSSSGTAEVVVASSDDDVYVAGVCTVGGDAGEIGAMVIVHATRLLSGFASNEDDETITGAWTFNGRIESINATAKTANYTVVSTDDNVVCDTSGGAFTVTLPASPEAGRVHAVILETAGNILTVSGNGKNIIGNATMTMSSAYDSASLIYSGAQWLLK